MHSKSEVDLRLSAEQIKSYERDGFLVIQGMYSPQEVQLLSHAIDEIASRKPEVGKQMAYYEDSLLQKDQRVLSRIEKFAEYSPVLKELVDSSKMTGYVSQLLGEPVFLFKEKVNFKLPGGGGFAPHQDIQPGWDDYCKYFISVLVTIDKSTPENGCLELSAGHHKRGWIGQRMKPMQGEELKGIEFTQVPMEPGDVAFFDCFVPHQSAPNLTKQRRRNLYLTYNRQSEGDHRDKYYADKRKNFPPDFEREPGKVYEFKV